MDPGVVILFILLFLLSGVFSGTEVALMSIPHHKIKSLLKEGRIGAKALKKIKDNNEKLLITILIGNNLVNVYTASLATQISIQIADKIGLSQSGAIGISTGVVTFLLLIFGEIFPKTFATRHNVGISLMVAKPYDILIKILYPVVVLIEVFIKQITPKERDAEITGEEIDTFLDMGKDSGTLEESEHKKLKNLLEFNDISAENIMTPRVKMDAVEISTTVNNALNFILSHTHTRLPIYEGTIDNIQFIINIRDLLREKDFGNGEMMLKDLNLDKVIKVPLAQPIDNLFETFQKSRKHIAIVMDEYGGVAGLVTLEDIIEEVFGDIRDESDKEVDQIRRIDDNKYLFQDAVLLDVVLEYFDINFEEIGLDKKEFSGSTLSYFITCQLERFPNHGEKISLDIVKEDESSKSIIFEVKEVSNGKIEGVEVYIEDKE